MEKKIAFLLLLTPVLLLAATYSIGGQRAVLEIPSSWSEVQHLSEGRESAYVYDTGYSLVSIGIRPTRAYEDYSATGTSVLEGMLSYLVFGIMDNYRYENYGEYADYGFATYGPYAYVDWIYHYDGNRYYGIKYLIKIDNYDIEIVGMQSSLSNGSKMRNQVLELANSLSM